METEKKAALVVLNHWSLQDFKAAHNNNGLDIFNGTDKNGVQRIFFTCGKVVGAISTKVSLPIGPKDRVQIIEVQGEKGPLNILCYEGGMEPMQTL